MTGSVDLGGLLRALAAEHGGRLAVAGEAEELSFSDLDRAADEWASGFAAAGLGRGSHIGLLAGNGPDWLAVAFGIWRSGATLVPISTFVTRRELHETLRHADLQGLVLQRRLRSHDYLESLAGAAPLYPSPRVILLDGEALAPCQNARTFRRNPPATFAAEEPESIACLLYTSGTTGRPKGVMLSHRAILSSVLPTRERSGLGAGDVLLSTLPLFWVAGLVIRALPTLAAGSALVLSEAFVPASVIAVLQRRRVTALHLRPPQVGALLTAPGFRASLINGVRRGNGRVAWYAPYLNPDETCFITGYGMTETAGYVTALDWRDPPDVRETQLGSEMPGVTMRIVDAEGRACEADEVGEIRVRCAALFSGYYKEPPGTGMDEDGFFRTGDLGRIDSDGRFHFVGRSKDLLRVKGINVSPVEVETVLAAHPAVESVYIVGLPQGGLDQRLVALFVHSGTADAARSADSVEAELRTHATSNLSHYKRPSEYIRLERREVPLGATAKPRRDVLAALAEAKSTGQRS